MTMPRLLMGVYALFFCFVIWYGAVASRTFDGAVKDSYEKGMAYPAQKARLKELGWTFQGGPRQLVQGEAGPLRLKIMLGDGSPVRGAEVTFAVARPASRETLPALTAQEIEAGAYQTMVTLPGDGHWFITASIRRGQDMFTYEFRTFAEKRG